MAAVLAAACRDNTPNGGQESHESVLGVTYASVEALPVLREDNDTTGWLVRRAAVIRLVDLPALHSAKPRDVRREARIAWLGGMFWTTVPLIRIVERNSGVSGEVLLYWFNLRDPAALQDPVGEIAASACDVITRDSTWSVCRLARPMQLDWREVADSVAALGLWSLPGEGVARRGPHPLDWPTDQTAVEIELREGDRYRAYRYYAADQLGTPDAMQVDAIITYLRRVIRRPR